MISFITGNKYKFAEMERFLNGGIVMCDINLPEIQSLNPQEVIEAKLREARKHIRKGAIIVDDSGHCFHALGRLPGPYAKDFLKELGLEGIHAMLERYSQFGDTAYTYIGYMDESGTIRYFSSSTEGRIERPRGQGGLWV